MGENRVRPPEFFGQIKPQEFEYRPGLFVSVAELSQLPPQLLEHEPKLAEAVEQGKKFVVKEYITQRQKNLRFKEPKDYDGRWSLGELTEKESVPNKQSGLPYKADMNPNRTLVESARILEERKNSIKQYFSDMPEFVLPNYIFIAAPDRGEAEKTLDDFTVYEVQEKIEDYIPLHEAVNLFGDASFKNKFTPEQLNILINDLRLLKSNLVSLVAERRHPVFSIFLPDLRAGNIVICKDGHLRTFDTNYFGSGANRPEMEAKIQSTIGNIENLLSLVE